MTENKARKRAVRTRMARTGERYTAARRHVVADRTTPPPADPGVSETAVLRGTGRSWEHWLRVLDEWGATKRTHAEIARHLAAEHGVGGWWAQSVTVGYERARGMRQRYQTASGFQVGVTRTLPANAATLYRSFVEPRRRNRWLEKGVLRIRTSIEPTSARFDFRDGSSRVVVAFEDKGPSKAAVHVQHERLSAAEDVERMRAFWKGRLAALAGSLSA